MKAALRIANARFSRDGRWLVPPFSLSLSPAEERTLVVADARAATIAARLCAGIVKPTTGCVYVGDFETHLQPPQAKRLVAYVDGNGFAGDAHAFACEAAFRAEVWGVPRARARERALEILARLSNAGDEAYARGIALALAVDASVVVLDRPTPEFVLATAALTPWAARLSVAVAGAATGPVRTRERDVART